MSTQPSQPAAPAPAPEGFVNIEIDGVALVAPKGSMIIQAADKAGIPIPRFCYHDKLSIAASCRMCLVDVEKSPKPAPACATPVMDGMKVYTQSKRALDSQRNTMEFLLINHPLDCPVCDQGGECELQDLAMGYGRSVGRFIERKRTVPDEDLGPLVASDMTRCIHCTRCVRVTSEIAGSYELGVMSRGDRSVIGTYVGRALETELSGNVIDVCPVGALTNKPFRFRARPWELTARESLGYHDALGSNLWLHLRRGEVLRAVPRENEAINENWLSDRDRYSHAGLGAPDRLTVPMVREGDAWREAGWDEALARAAEIITAQPGDEVGVLMHPATSNEEGSLLAALAAGIGCGNLDHRIALADLSDAPVAEPFQMPLAGIEKADVIVLVGCNPRHEAPLLGHRVRKAWRNGGAKVVAINPVDFDLNFDLAHRHIVRPSALVDALLGICKAAGASLPGGIGSEAIAAGEAQAIADLLRGAQRALILLGESAATHPQASWLRAAAGALSAATGARLDAVPVGANAVGLARAGALPTARNAAQMLAQPRKAWVLYGIEPEHDFADTPTALRALSQGRVVAFTAFADETTRNLAQVMLPIGLAPEIEASFTNADGLVQTTVAAAKLPGEAQAGWRALRALGERMGVAGFDFIELAQWRERMTPGAAASGSALAPRAAVSAQGLECIATRAIYGTDAVLRRAAPLQAHPLARGARLILNPEDAAALGLEADAMARIDDGRGKAALPVEISVRVPRGAAWIEKGYAATAPIAGTGASLTVTRA
ncbi:MAG TPA: NADH-quinone oxidoreductase subunit NuoG [Chiayiivirga sp.]|nr:NADH-quinone oxidoreductase subunit NuoG [Chiayiivirga sp.]